MSLPSRNASCHPSRKHEAKGLCKPCYYTHYSRTNRARVNQIKRKWRGSNPEKTRDIARRYQYGAEQAARIAPMLEAQGGLCAICLRAPAEHADHDHATGLIRGMLCFKCNVGLGNFGDNAEVLGRAIAYLRKAGS